ncbi:hypothetical protein ACRRTK_012422 [Alexandromys fortis]
MELKRQGTSVDVEMEGSWTKDNTVKIIHTGISLHIHSITMDSSGKADVTVPVHGAKVLEENEEEDVVEVLQAAGKSLGKLKEKHGLVSEYNDCCSQFIKTESSILVLFVYNTFSVNIGKNMELNYKEQTRVPPSVVEAQPARTLPGRGCRMASPARSGFPARTNSRLDAFLRRHLAPEVYDAVRAYEPCIVVSDAEKHTFKYVVLSDRLIYLTENPPKSIRRVVALRDVVAIDLVPPGEQHAIQGLNSLSFRPQPGVPSWPRCHSAFAYSLQELPVYDIYRPGCLLVAFCRATLSQDSLRSSEDSLVSGTPKPYRSEEKIKHFSQLKSELFLQDNTLRKILSLIMELRIAAQRNFILKRLFWKTSELFYFLVNKLHEYLPESRDKTALQNKSQRASELVACIEIIRTLGLMFRETEIESSRLSTLAAKKGTLFNLLVILITKPTVPKSSSLSNTQPQSDSTAAEMSFDAQLQKLTLEYTDTATALLYEILLVFQQGNLGLGSTKFAITWMMSFLQSCPPTMAFVASIVKRVVNGLSASLQLLSPCQAVLLYQQFYILKSCLQYSKTLAEHIRNDHSEEFRYFIHVPALEKRLPGWYPITEPTTQLCREVLQLIEQKQYAKF